MLANTPVIVKIIKREHIDMQSVVKIGHATVVAMKRAFIANDATVVVLHLIVTHVVKAVIGVTLEDAREPLIILTRHPHVDVVIPGDYVPMPCRTDEGAVSKPINQPMDIAKVCKMVQSLLDATLRL